MSGSREKETSRKGLKFDQDFTRKKRHGSTEAKAGKSDTLGCTCSVISTDGAKVELGGGRREMEVEGQKVDWAQTEGMCWACGWIVGGRGG